AQAENCFSAPASTDVEMKTLPEIPTIESNSPVKEGEELKMNATCKTPGVSFSWKGPNGFNETGDNVSKKDMTKPDEGIYYVHVSKDGCGASALTVISVESNANSVYRLFPSPGNGLLTLEGLVHTQNAITIAVINS